MESVAGAADGQIMFSTGPMFLTVQYALADNLDGVAVLPPFAYNKYDRGKKGALFEHLHGSSWHQDDAAGFLWLDHHKKALAIVGGIALLGAVVGYLAYQHGSVRPLRGDIETGRKLFD